MDYQSNKGIIHFSVDDTISVFYDMTYDLTLYEQNLCYKKDYLSKNKELFYAPTDIRLEHIDNYKEFLELLYSVSDEPIIEVFTHEQYLADKNIKKYMRLISEFGDKYNYVFNYVKKDMM